MVSIDLKADEPAIHALAARLGVPARFFPAATLEAEAPGWPTRPSWCSARPAAMASPRARRSRRSGRTARCWSGQNQVGARDARDRPRAGTARSGRGSAARTGSWRSSASARARAGWRTAEAEALLADAEDWVGYRGYLELLGPRRAARPVRHGFALGEEVARAEKALDLAGAGRRVALISSGDAGIYGMAALVFELLERSEDAAWQRVALTFSPGVSALQAAAARAGAPLGHDFCAISLSDLLTPWPLIERRLEAAAAADFVTVLYNPASAASARRPRARARDPGRGARSGDAGGPRAQPRPRGRDGRGRPAGGSIRARSTC